jgi:aryl-alcohol dehydrogenase-like predicted oxidoreductase
MYSLGRSEEILGGALRDFAKREQVVIATKVFNPMSDDPNDRGLSRKHVMASIDASLRRLGTDYVDLYQIHRWDPDTPIEETLQALHDVVRAGKVRYIGASSTMSWQFAKALYLADLHGWTRFVSMQNHYNLIYREEEREMIPLCIEEGIGVIPWSPLARGFLAGNRKRGSRTATIREETDTYGHGLYYGDADYDVADRRRDQARAARSGRRSDIDQAVPRRDRSARSAVRAASRARHRLTFIPSSARRADRRAPRAGRARSRRASPERASRPPMRRALPDRVTPGRTASHPARAYRRARRARQAPVR